MKISIVSPVYKSEKIVAELVVRLTNVLKDLALDYEIILVDDRSPDNSWNEIESACTRDNRIKGVRLSRNFGQHYALTAGIAEASGDYIIVMDCDLQDDPIFIPKMLELVKNGSEIVLTYKKKREHSAFKNFTAWLYFKALQLTTGTKDSIYVGSFSLITRKVQMAFLQYKDVHRHYLPILKSLGFAVSFLEIEHRERFEGESSYTLFKLIKHALNGIISQSLTLLYISIFVGFLFFVISLFGVAYYLFTYLTHNVMPGFTSLAIFILLSTGLILISIGVLGIYIGKIFDQVRGRPLYLVDQRLNTQEGNF